MVVDVTDEEILRTWLDALARQDAKRLDALTADGFAVDGDAREMGHDAFLETVDALWSACPDWEVEIDDVHPEDGHLVAEVSIRGTQDGDLDLTGAGLGWKPGTGTSFEVTGRPAFDLEDGRVARQRSGPGSLSDVLESLGLGP